MNPRKLAFASSVAPLVAAISFVPFLGTGLGLYFSLVVWAGAGFRWWLLSLAMSVAVDLNSILQFNMASGFVASTAAPVTNVIIAHPVVGFIWLGLQLSMFALYPTVLYLGKRNFAKMLAKRGLLR